MSGLEDLWSEDVPLTDKERIEKELKSLRKQLDTLIARNAFMPLRDLGGNPAFVSTSEISGGVAINFLYPEGKPAITIGMESGNPAIRIYDRDGVSRVLLGLNQGYPLVVLTTAGVPSVTLTSNKLGGGLIFVDGHGREQKPKP